MLYTVVTAAEKAAVPLEDFYTFLRYGFIRYKIAFECDSFEYQIDELDLKIFRLTLAKYYALRPLTNHEIYLSELAKEFGLKTSDLSPFILKRIIPARKFGKFWVVPKDFTENYIAKTFKLKDQERS